MDKTFKLLDEMIVKSSQNTKHTKHGNWKYCVALYKLGWEAYDFETIGDSEVIIKWRKIGQDELNIKLNFADQRLWIKYLREKESKDDNK